MHDCKRLRHNTPISTPIMQKRRLVLKLSNMKSKINEIEINENKGKSTNIRAMLNSLAKQMRNSTLKKIHQIKILMNYKSVFDCTLFSLQMFRILYVPSLVVFVAIIKESDSTVILA